MAAELGTPAAPRVRVAVSPIFNLAFALFAVKRHELKVLESAWLARLVNEDRALVDEIVTFWPHPNYDEWAELSVVAVQEGHLFDGDLEPFLAGLPELLTSERTVPELATEPAPVRGFVQERLDALRQSRELRERYVRMLARLWAFLRPEWERTQIEAARIAASVEKRLGDSHDVLSVVPNTHLARQEQFAPLVLAAAERGTLAMAPFGVTAVGQCILAVGETVIVSFGAETGKKASVRRERGVTAARRFKVLSDPTRLALLNAMVHGPITITDLAGYFELSQPTVSVHVKMLREAGLLESEKQGNTTLYRALPETIRQFIETASADILAE